MDVSYVLNVLNLKCINKSQLGIKCIDINMY